jgi:hypothetical protein
MKKIAHRSARSCIHPSAWKADSSKFARGRSAFAQEGGLGVARLSDSPSSEARMIAECLLCTRLSPQSCVFLAPLARRSETFGDCPRCPSSAGRINLCEHRYEWYQSGIKKPPLLTREFTLSEYSAYLRQLERADERTRSAFLLITSDNSCVAGVCAS